MPGRPVAEYPDTMAGYAAMSRIERTAPRFRRRRGSEGTDDARVEPLRGPAVDVDLPDVPGPSEVQDLTGAGFAADLVELLADIRQVWRQGMEVLADPQGWRS